MLEDEIQMIPKRPGSYLLWLYLARKQSLTVGRLGQFNFPSGDYVYLGSARGPGGLQARLGRHLRGCSLPHWHIDRLRAVTQVCGFGYITDDMHPNSDSRQSSSECNWSKMLADMTEAYIPASGFGASDCQAGCAAHLVHFSREIQHILERFAGQTGIYIKDL